METLTQILEAAKQRLAEVNKKPAVPKGVSQAVIGKFSAERQIKAVQGEVLVAERKLKAAEQKLAELSSSSSQRKKIEAMSPQAASKPRLEAARQQAAVRDAASKQT